MHYERPPVIQKEASQTVRPGCIAAHLFLVEMVNIRNV